MIAAYPDAKIIFVERDYDKWIKSLDDGLLRSLWSGLIGLVIDYAEPFVGQEGGGAVRKMFLGFFRAQNYKECKMNARETYERYNEEVRAACKGEEHRLLEFKLGSGWEPLCEFLDRPVPDVPFPWTNELAMVREVAFNAAMTRAKLAVCKGFPYAVAFGALGMATLWCLGRV